MKIKIIIATMILLSDLYANVDTIYVPYLGQMDINWTFQMTKLDNHFQYDYRIHSLETSKQDIWSIRIEYKGDCIYEYHSPQNWFSFKSDSNRYAGGRSFLAWGPDDFDYMITPGNRLDGFQIVSSGLPFIAYYYSKGYFPPPHIEFGEEEPVIIGSMNVYQNSKKGKTIGPASPPTPFLPAAFLDTLISYNGQSFDLGWIKDTGTRDKYGNYLSTAKSSLAQGRISSCRQELGNILRDVAQDSEVAITSEAYSLLRYNTEYLLEQLPQGEVTTNDLIAYIQDASQTGKIDNKGVANSLISKLETAQKQIDKDKTKQAVNAFNAFLNELEAQKEKHVNIEVYNYLKEKVEALIEQISVGW